MSESMKILIVPSNGYGHLNIGLGLADMLSKKGHKPIFLLNKQWAKAAEARGYEARLIDNGQPEADQGDQAARQMEVLAALAPSLDKPTIEQLTWMNGSETMLSEDHITIDTGLESLLSKETFDLIIVATLLALPSAEASGTPWVYFHTPSPHVLYGEQLTPPFSGYPLNTDKAICQEYWKRYYIERASGEAIYNKYLASKGVGPVNTGYFARESPYLNIYAYPEVLDYKDVGSLPANYFRMDNAIREDDGLETVIPKEFLEKPGKLIYVSLGSWFSGVIDVMKNLLAILAKSPHKFIISKGPNHEKIELPENMWGQRFLNQLKLLPMVDLVITHGGNNTTVECLHNGKPMIVLPFFIDQHDNAQRIQEKGLGIKFSPFDLKEKELLEAVEKLLNDQHLSARLKVISDELKNSTTRDQLIALLETIVREKKCPVNGKSEEIKEPEVKTNGNVVTDAKTVTNGTTTETEVKLKPEVINGLVKTQVKERVEIKEPNGSIDTAALMEVKVEQ